jgi:drug/metabolite transporter (DMT)-like permease
VKRWFPEIAIAIVVLIWSTTWIAMKDALSVFDPLAYMTSRFVMITALAWLVILVRQSRFTTLRIDRADWRRLVIGAMAGYTFYQLFGVFALDKSSVFTISLLVALVPLFTMVMMAAMGEVLPPYGWLGLGVAIVGTVVFLSDKREAGDTLLGAFLSLAAAVSFAAYGLINRPLVKRYPSEVLAAWQLLIGTVPLVLIGGPSALDQPWSEMDARIWVGFVFVVVFPVYVAYQLWNYAISRRGAAVASSYGLLVPIISAVLAAIAFDEHLTVLKLAGAALAIAGVLLVRAPAGWRPRIPGLAQ